MLKRSLSLTFGLLLSAGVAQAQGGTCNVAGGSNSCNETHVVTATMPQIVSMTLTGNVALTAPVASDFVGNVAVISNAAAGSLTIKSNKVYSLTVVAGAANFTSGLGASGSTKPAGDLEVNLAAGSYTALSTTAATLATAQARTDNQAYAIGYRTTYKLSQDEPDSYTLALTYSITTP